MCSRVEIGGVILNPASKTKKIWIHRKVITGVNCGWIGLGGCKEQRSHTKSAKGVRGHFSTYSPPTPAPCCSGGNALLSHSDRSTWAWPLALPLHQPSKPQTTFNAADDLEALGSKPVGHDEEDDNKGGIQEAVAVGGFPLHARCTAPLCPGSPVLLFRGVPVSSR